MYDIIEIIMIINDITHECRCRTEKLMLGFHHFHGKECLHVHLLKPARLDVPPGQLNVVFADDMQTAPAWL